MRLPLRLSVIAASVLLLCTPALAAPRVIASVVPVHAIVSAVMGETGKPELLLKGTMSEHRASFSPAQIAALGEADLVFIVGEGLEAKLAQLSGSEAVNGKRFIALSEAPGVETLPVRQGGNWEPDADMHQTSGAESAHAEGVLAFDPHVWLDPRNAKAMAAEVARRLSAADSANAAAYTINAQAFSAGLDKLSGDIAAQLAPVRATPYIVFHDAYQYFEHRFGLAAAGSISDVSARTPSARRIEEIRAKLRASGARCVFREPQYDGKLVAAVIEGTPAREGVLDPLGAGLIPGPDAYDELMRKLAETLTACLAG